MRRLSRLSVLMTAVLWSTVLQAQTYFPGKIIRAAGTTNLKTSSGTPSFAFPSAVAATVTGADILNPDGNTVVSTSGSGFSAGNDVSGSEINYKPITPYSVEPFGDLRRGPSHMFSDFVPGVDNASYYMYYRGTSGTEALQFRIRLGSVSSGAKGYSILLDTDGKFGATGTDADPNYKAATSGVNGNPGFEIEIDLFTQTSGQTGIAIYNVDGIDNPSTATWSATNWLDYSQLSIAATSDNGDPDFFLDFFIPFAKLSSLGVTASTTLRAVATTVMATQPAIGGPKSDIYGLADGTYKDPNTQYATFINTQPSFTSTTLGLANTSSPTSAMCTAAPVVGTVVAGTGNGQVQGTWVKSTLTGALSTADVTVYKTQNGVTTTLGTVTNVSSNTTWTLSSLTIASGDVITARAKGTTESMCLESNPVRATACANPSTRPAEPVLSCGPSISKGVTGTNKTTGWTVWVQNVTRNTTEDDATNPGAIFSPETNASPNINWMYSSGCSGGSNMTSGSYRIWYTDANGCQSDPVLVCQAGNGPTALASSTPLIAPVVTSPTAFTTGTKTVTGTASSGSTVYLFVNGIQVASTTVSGTISTATTGTFTFSSGLSFSTGDVVVLSSGYNPGTVSASYCATRGATKYTVGCSVAAPVINANNAGQVNIGAAIAGTSTEAAGTTLKLYNSSNALLATTTVQSNGSWTTSGAAFSNGFTGVAVASGAYYATCTNGTCVSASSATISAATGVTSSNRCGTISANVPSGNITSATTSITVAYNNATNLKVTLYEDGQSVISQTGLTGNSTYAFDVTGKLYAGNGSTTGILTIGVQESGQEEIVCSSSYFVQPSCTSPASPAVSPSNSQTVASGNTLTYTIQSPTSGVFYTISDQSTGQELASGIWATSTSDFTMTTQPISANTVAVVKAVQMASSGEVCLAATTRSISVLPITILEFTGRRNGTSNVLNWKTSLEVAASHFEVEQSTDGNTFKQIGTITTNGSGANYSFTDAVPVRGVNFYRLKLVDINGRFTYSKVIMLNDGSASFIVSNVQPNPFKTGISLSVYLPLPQVVSVTLFDAMGKQVETRIVNGAQGLNTLNLTDLDGLSRGVYMVRIATPSGMQQYKLLKE